MPKDEQYIIDTCDRILGLKAYRGHRFDFLRGDPGRNGRGRMLPVDAFYPALSLIVEYCERQHAEPVSHFDKPWKTTVSGVHRGLQRQIFDRRRRNLLPYHGFDLMELNCSEFRCDKAKRLCRIGDADEMVIRSRLWKYIA